MKLRRGTHPNKMAASAPVTTRTINPSDMRLVSFSELRHSGQSRTSFLNNGVSKCLSVSPGQSTGCSAKLKRRPDRPSAADFCTTSAVGSATASPVPQPAESKNRWKMSGSESAVNPELQVAVAIWSLVRPHKIPGSPINHASTRCDS
jgi:hypothetical protein